jgi:hypothetical protein
MKNERMIQIEKELELSEDQIRNAIAMIHDKFYAEKNKNLKEYEVIKDIKLKELCLEYLENYYLLKNA